MSAVLMGGHNFLIQRIDNGGIHARNHHQGNKGSVDDVSLGQAIGDVEQAAGDVDLGKLCLDGSYCIKNHHPFVGIGADGLDRVQQPAHVLFFMADTGTGIDVK